MAKPDVERLWQLMSSIPFCMLSTWDGERMHSRPMGAFFRREDSAVFFFTDDQSRKYDEIRRYPRVYLSFVDVRRQKYVSACGIAEISRDLTLIQKIWALPARVWWKVPSNPHLCLIKFTLEEAEYWDTPGNLISNLDIALALVTGSKPRAGVCKKVAP
jgi:general stress protein 26